MDELSIKSDLKLKCEVRLNIKQGAISDHKKPRATWHGVSVMFRGQSRNGLASTSGNGGRGRDATS
jgi:hypothetical protein